MSKTSNKNDFDFTQAMRELEDITSYLESDDVQIEEAMKKFERGSELAIQIKNYLQDAENTISTIKSTLK